MRRAFACFLALCAQACAARPSGDLPNAASSSVPLPTPVPFAIPSPRPSPTDLAYDIRFRTALARTHLGDNLRVDVEDGVYALFAAADSRSLDPSLALVRQALPALYSGRFSRHPTRAVSVYVFEDSAKYKEFCQARFGYCESPYGFYVRESREVVVDQHYGIPTILHELVHVILDEDFPEAPRWLREGIAALYELPVISGTTIHGKTNGRRATLLPALGRPAEHPNTTLDGLFSIPYYVFYEKHPDAPVAHATARFVCQWLDSPGQDHLWKFYQTWRDHAGDDPTGEKSFAAVMGQTPSEANAAWEKWARAL